MPIRDAEALYALGRQQHNCVASYKDLIVEGSVYIYRVTVGAEVSTLSLAENHCGGCVIDELKTVCNLSVSKQTRLVVDRWFQKGHPWPLPPTKLRNRLSTPIEAAPPFAPTPLPGGKSGPVEIIAIRNIEALTKLLGSSTLTDSFSQRARSGREHFYQAVSAQSSHMVSIERDRIGYRLKEVRRIGSNTVGGDVLIAVSDWLGRTQGRYR